MFDRPGQGTSRKMKGDAVSDQGMVLELGPLRIDVPRSVGFYGGIAAAVGLGLIDPPLGLFIACVPLMKMATNSRAPQLVQWVGQIFDGMAKPLGGDSEGTIRLADPGALIQEAANTVAVAARAPGTIKRQAAATALAESDRPDDPAT